MIKIVSDSSSLYNKESGKNQDIEICPLGVTIDDKAYKDLEDICLDSILKFIGDGATPKTSQPSIGDVLDIYENINPLDDILHITIASGLSGAYETAQMGKNMVNRDNIHIIDSRTLCGPHKYLVDLANKLAKEGKDLKTIKEAILKRIETTKSYLIPQDFQFLKRGGRLTPLAVTLASVVKLVPVMTLNDDCKIEKHSINRTLSKAFDSIIAELKKHNLTEKYKIFVSHDNSNIKGVEKLKNILKEHFPHVEIEELLLSPAFIVQGGPGCIAVQTVEI